MLPQNNNSDQHRIILNLSFGAFIRDAGQYVIWVIMAVYLNEVRSLSYIEIGLVFLIAGITSVPVSIAGGNLLDRVGRRKLAVLIPWIMCAISLALFVLVFSGSSIIPIVSLLIIAGPIQSLQQVTINSIISDVTAFSERISGFSALRIASNVGIGVGLVTGGLLSQINYSYVFLLAVAGYFIEGIIYYSGIPETSVRTSGKPDGTRVKARFFVPYRDGFFISMSVIISVTWFFTGMFESPLTPLYMSSVNHFSTFSITILFAINTITVILGQTPVNRLLRKVKDSSRIVLGLLVYAMAYVIFAETSVYIILGLSVAILTLGENISAPASGSLITKIAPEDKRGAYLGFNSSVDSLITPFRPIVGTVLLTATVETPGLSWLTVAFISFGLAVTFFVVFRNRP